MLAVTNIQLLPTNEQSIILKNTINQFHIACNKISRIAYDHKCFSKVKLQKICYHNIRKEFPTLSSHLVIRAIAKVCEVYKRGELYQQEIFEFNLDGSILYDKRIMSVKGLEYISLSTVEGRIEIPFVVTGYSMDSIQGKRTRGQADLVLKNDKFFLYLAIGWYPDVESSATHIIHKP
ncbi:hypothetical protein [Bacillus sp. Brlt_9]|uniref:hypothetical protein n=1 Tax=Bacillus sp. Brlt_9 TaxID=3110916 RepID=UPI003F7BAEF9